MFFTLLDQNENVLIKNHLEFNGKLEELFNLSTFQQNSEFSISTSALV